MTKRHAAKAATRAQICRRNQTWHIEMGADACGVGFGRWVQQTGSQ
jgi:hypothetical protein